MIKRIFRYALYRLYPFIPKSLRWKIAHWNHVNWKFRMLDEYGEEQYFRMYDDNARHLLEKLGLNLDFSDKTVVEIGCGLRGILGVIKAGLKIGIDPSLTDKVKSRFSLQDDIMFLTEKAERLSLRNGIADYVFCLNTINHVEDPRKVMSEIERILKKDGLFIIDVYLNQRGLGHTHVLSFDDIFKLLKNFISIKTHYSNRPERFGGIFKK